MASTKILKVISKQAAPQLFLVSPPEFSLRAMTRHRDQSPKMAVTRQSEILYNYYQTDTFLTVRNLERERTVSYIILSRIICLCGDLRLRFLAESFIKEFTHMLRSDPKSYKGSAHSISLGKFLD